MGQQRNQGDDCRMCFPSCSKLLSCPRKYVDIKPRPGNRILQIKKPCQLHALSHQTVPAPRSLPRIPRTVPAQRSRSQLAVGRSGGSVSRPGVVDELPREQAARRLVKEHVGVAVQPGEELVHQVSGFGFRSARQPELRGGKCQLIMLCAFGRRHDVVIGNCSPRR